MDLRKVRELADGRIFSGEQAHASDWWTPLGAPERHQYGGGRAGIVGEPRVNRPAPAGSLVVHILFDMAPADSCHAPALDCSSSTEGRCCADQLIRGDA